MSLASAKALFYGRLGEIPGLLFCSGVSLGNAGEGKCSKIFHSAKKYSGNVFKNKYGFQPEKVMLKIGKNLTF